jgi:AcrR family transcriptional regulator
MGTRKARVTRDPEGTRARILAAATDIFAEHGFAGARVDAIAASAEINMRMIYHYFQDKSGLYVAVLESLLGALRDAERRRPASGRTPIEGLLEIYDTIFEHFGNSPQLVRILSTENIMSARFLKSSVATPVVASPSLRNIEALLERGRSDGTIRRQVDPLHLYVVMVGLAYFHRSNGHTLSHIWLTDVSDPEWQDDHRKLGAEMLRAFLISGATA